MAVEDRYASEDRAVSRAREKTATSDKTSKEIFLMSDILYLPYTGKLN